MTYEETLKARARMAYGQVGLVKKAEQSPFEAASRGLQEAETNYNNALANMDFQTGLVQNPTAKTQWDDISAILSKYPGVGEELASQGLLANGIPVKGADLAQILSIAQGRAKDLQTISDTQNATAKNIGWGALAGLGGGAAVGGVTYGLAGLFPSLRKRRLLRALIALGAGAAGGAGLGYLTYQGMQNGKIPEALGNAAEKAKGAYGDAKNWTQAQINKLKGGGESEGGEQ